MKPGSILKITSVGILVLFTVIFAYFKAHDLLLGVKITIDSPNNGETLNEPFIVIKGSAPGNTLLTLNGAKVLTDATGSFQKEMLLGLGYNIVEIRELDRFNREDRKTLELVYKPTLENQRVSLNN